MQTKLIQILIIIVGLFVAFWVITSSVVLPENLQVSTLVSIILIGLIAVIFRKQPFDYKLLSLLLLGYAFAGKGFAYITPMEPIYIGEIVLIFCTLGYLLRLIKGAKLFPDPLHWLILIWMAVVGIYLIDGFQKFGKLAIRDSAIGYYGIFFFASYAIFRNGKLNRAFGKVLIACILLSYMGCFIVITGIYDKVFTHSVIVHKYFEPHADAYLPLVAAGTIFGLMEGITRKSILFLFIGAIGFILLAGSKTAGIFALIVLIGFLVVFVRRVDLLVTSAIAVTITAVTFGILLASGSTAIEKKIMESDQIRTISDVGNSSGRANDSTSDWRISWWSIIAEDTMKENPLYGCGLGGDISGHFLESVMRMDIKSINAQSYARYPHCVIMTVFGRLGLVGLSFFIILLFGFARFLILYARRYLRETHIDSTGLIAFSIFLAGVANAMVQSTYEVPHGAIMNWVCLGYLVAHYHQGNVSRKTIPNMIGQQHPSNA